jgi:hypothetical protein
LGLNFNIPTDNTIALSSFVGTPWDVAPSSITQTGSGNFSEFGDMNTTVTLNDGYTRALKELTFTATLKDALHNQVNFTDALTVLMNNTNNPAYFAAAHIFVQNTLDTAAAVKTGMAGNGVPLPGAVMLLGAGMVRLVAYARRRKEE